MASRFSAFPDPNVKYGFGGCCNTQIQWGARYPNMRQRGFFVSGDDYRAKIEIKTDRVLGYVIVDGKFEVT